MGESTYLPPRPSTAGPALSGICATKLNAEVKAIHLKAMSVILTTQAEIETWLTAPIKDALA
jgi:putative SOS response-associated peptidase YedK